MRQLQLFHQRLHDQKFALLIISVIALLPRILLIYTQSAIIWTDGVGYYNSAQYMLANRTIASELISHSSLYPLFLSLFISHGETPQVGIAVLTAQHALGFLSVIFLYLTARQVFDPIVAFYSALLLSWHSLLLCYECVIESEIMMFFTLSIATYLAVRALKNQAALTYSLTGAFCALAALSRPAAQLYVACIILVILLSVKDLKKFLRAAIIIGGTYAAVVTPFIYTNSKVHGFVGLSHGEGLNLISRAFDVDHLRPIKDTAYPELRAVYKKIAEKPHQICYRFHRYLKHKLNYSVLAADKAMFAISKETLLAHPFIYLRHTVILFYDFFIHAKNSVAPCPPEIGVNLCKRPPGNPHAFRLNPDSRGWLGPILALYFRLPSFIAPWFVICSCIGVFLYFKRAATYVGPRPTYVYGLLLVLTACYFGLITSAFRKPHDRYRFPADPALIMFAVYCFYEAAISLLIAKRRHASKLAVECSEIKTDA